jgi:predicted regulator of Ras-like GTPase activity (Roadblock/LC7/MglB family)
VADGSGVQLPLYTIIAVLPLELKTRIRQTMVAEIFVSLSFERVLPQLGTGSVKITFGELRELAPNVFSVQTDLDDTEIALPLNEILPQINPAMLSRQGQRHVAVPEDVRGPFGNDFAGVTLADPRTAAAGAAVPTAREARMPMSPMPASPAPAPAHPVRPAMPAPQMRPAPSAPPMPSIQAAKPAMPMPQPRPAAPVQPSMPVRPSIPMQPAAPMQQSIPMQPVRPVPQAAAPAPAPVHEPLTPAQPIPFRPSSIAATPTPRPPTPAGPPPIRPAVPAAPRGAGVTPLPSNIPRPPAAPVRPAAPAAMPTPMMAAPAAPAAPAMPEVFVDVPLAMMCEAWPEVLRAEIEQLNLSQVSLALPVRIVEPALKLGKVAFTWKVLRSWIRPAILPTVSAHDEMVLELPLRVLAPLFMARQKGQRNQQKLQINEKIPNLFFGFPQPDEPIVEEAPVVAPAPMAPPPQPMLQAQAPIAMAPMDEIPQDIFVQKGKAPAPAVAPVRPAPAAVPDTNFYRWDENGQAREETEFTSKSAPHTDFLSRYATPNEVVSRAAALEGVAGALVALPDGLMVASKLSPDLNGDTLAAFLPHIFGKVSQCTKELRMGELNNLNFTVGNVPWKIFRVNAIFFAAFGRAGQPLPTGQLAALAGELDRKKQ